MIREHQYRSDYNGGPCTYRYHLTLCGKARNVHEEVDYVTKANDLSTVVDNPPLNAVLDMQQNA